NTGAVNPSYLYFGQATYNNAIAVAPGTTNTVVMCGSLCSKSIDGGTTWASPTMSGGSYHVDVHDLQYDAAGTLYFATDGGIYSSPDSGNNSVSRNTGLVTAQFYKITIDRSNVDRVMGGLQDNGTWRRFTAASTTWDSLISSDGQGCQLSSSNPSLGWASNQAYSGGNYLWQTKNIAGPASPPPLFVLMSPIFPGTESLPFDTQVETDPQRPSVLYTNTNRLWRSMTGGDAFAPLPTTTTDASTWNSYIIDSIAIAPTDYQTIMVAKGPDVYRSSDGGSTWTRRDTGLPGYWVNTLTIDPFDANTAYAGLATTSGTSVYYTSNGGASWTAHSSGLP
ncbi:MAG TPA: hypothetical protein VKT80_14905, partial [Chloroflexota bacterium]|nr:hypothetical protein [Chloroflexota bacterium]